MSLSKLHSAIKDASLAAIWNKGIKLAKDADWFILSAGTDEIKIQCKQGGQPVSPKVTLWLEDADWYCDCGDRYDPCVHSIGAVLAYKAGDIKKAKSSTSSSSGKTKIAQTNASYIRYDFVERDGFLCLERYWCSRVGEQKLSQSLTALAGGLQSGRIQGPSASFTKADFAVDHLLLATHNWNLLDLDANTAIWPKLCECENHTYQGREIKLNKQSLGLCLTLKDCRDGLEMSLSGPDNIKKRFANGFAMVKEGLAYVQLPQLTREEEGWLKMRQRTLSMGEAQVFLSEVFPALKEKIVCNTKGLGKWKMHSEEPRIVLNLQSDGPEKMSVLPRLVYGSPSLAERKGAGLQFLADKEVPVRNKAAEDRELMKLRHELSIPPDQFTVFEGEAAIQFLERTADWETRGSAIKQFQIVGSLNAQLKFDDESLTVSFTLPRSKSQKNSYVIPSDKIFDAWKSGRGALALGDGLWAKIPKDWLQLYGERLQRILAARHPADNKLPRYFLPELADLMDSTGQQPPPLVAKARLALERIDSLPNPHISEHLLEILRPYQKQGISWLQNHCELGLGALLADDMGLGKTLQTLCSVKGRTLILAPTSVIYAWAEQIKRFKTDLDFILYHGKDRKWDPNAQIVITSHALLRFESKRFLEVNWDTIVLDEAQIIKNPDSQTAQLCHQLKADWRIALTGTPVENELRDIWSIFHFLLPGLLGSRSEFSQYSEDKKLLELKARVRPFILRRRKEDVAKDLPPKTEITIPVVLSEEERSYYQMLLQSTRPEVMNALEHGQSIFAALELLLRLRQACCDLRLIPTLKNDLAPEWISSKIEMLREKLVETVRAGHAALVFSQWTALLDLIEPVLQRENIPFLRIDGSTLDRNEKIDAFQDPAGPPIMLVSLKAGGTGLTLTRADHVFIIDPWWNPAVEEQAGARAHRIGQTKPVLIYRLVTQATVEEGIQKLKDSKRALSDFILQDQAGSSITKDDLRMLLLDIDAKQ